MLDLDRGLVAVVLSAVLDSVIVGHDTPFTIFDRSSRLRCSVVAAYRRRA
jgi:hypothetical protein